MTSFPAAGAAKTDFLEGVFPEPGDRETSQAARFIQEGLVEVLHFGPVAIGDDLWTCDRTWRWALHAFLPLNGLIAAGAAAGVAELSGDWLAKLLEARGKFPWDDPPRRYGWISYREWPPCRASVSPT